MTAQKTALTKSGFFYEFANRITSRSSRALVPDTSYPDTSTPDTSLVVNTASYLIPTR